MYQQKLGPRAGGYIGGGQPVVVVRGASRSSVTCTQGLGVILDRLYARKANPMTSRA